MRILQRLLLLPIDEEEEWHIAFPEPQTAWCFCKVNYVEKDHRQNIHQHQHLHHGLPIETGYFDGRCNIVVPIHLYIFFGCWDNGQVAGSGAAAAAPGVAVGTTTTSCLDVFPHKKDPRSMRNKTLNS